VGRERARGAAAAAGPRARGDAGAVARRVPPGRLPAGAPGPSGGSGRRLSGGHRRRWPRDRRGGGSARRVRLRRRGGGRDPRVPADVTLYLRRTEVGDYSALVEGSRPEDAPTRRTLRHEELVNVPGSLNDPIRVVQNLPGMNRAPYLGGALLVRGTPPAD